MRLTKADHERLNRVGPGTPMGNWMRRHWIAALLSEELPAPDCPPKKIRLLGEDLVAFRDSTGRVGIMDLHCPHRGASLHLARNENCALQCIYHGWRIDADGRVVDTPNEPPSSRMKERIRIRAYEVREKGGFIWAYMGPEGSAPPLPAFEWMEVDSAYRMVEKVLINCTWLHGIENSIDAYHGLHLHGDTRWQLGPEGPEAPAVPDHSGTLAQGYDAASLAELESDIVHWGEKIQEVVPEPYGFRLGVLRDTAADPENLIYARSSFVVAPWYYSIAVRANRGCMPFYVAVDDEHTMLHNVRWTRDEPFGEREAMIRRIDGAQPVIDINPDFTHTRNASNNWLQDRDLMGQFRNHCGVPGVIAQDVMAMESVTTEFDFSMEHHGVADVPTDRFREMLLEEVARLEKTGEFTMHAGVPEVARARAWQKVIPKTTRWTDLDAFTLFPEFPPVDAAGAASPGR